jgi:hypothetical protein
MKRAIRQFTLLAAVLVAASAILAAPAAASWEAILQDCVLNDGLQGSYKRSELQEAKRHVTGERVAYTECGAEISAAMNAAAASNNGPGGSGGNGLNADTDGDGIVSPEEKRAAKRKKARETREVAVLNDSLKPDDSVGTIGGDDSSGGGNVGMILAILALVMLAVAGGTWYAARRNPAVANALRRVPLLGRRS